MSKELSPAAFVLVRHLEERGGPRTVSTLQKEGIQDAFSTALANLHLFTISAGSGPSPVIALNTKPAQKEWAFNDGIAVGMVAMGIVFLFILFVIFGNKNIW